MDLADVIYTFSRDPWHAGAIAGCMTLALIMVALLAIIPESTEDRP